MKRQLLVIVNKGAWRQKKIPVSILNCRDVFKTLMNVSDKVYKSLNTFIYRK